MFDNPHQTSIIKLSDPHTLNIPRSDPSRQGVPLVLAVCFVFVLLWDHGENQTYQ
jgi:hypothetical protein